MLRLASIIFLNPRPILQPTAEERYIIKRINRIIMRRFYLALIGMSIAMAVIVTLLIMFA